MANAFAPVRSHGRPHGCRARVCLSVAVLVLGLSVATGCRTRVTVQTDAGLDLAGGAIQLQDTLYFGTARQGAGPVTDAEWQTFVDEVVTPRFPEGLTMLNATGQWRDSRHSVLREATRILIIIHPAAPDCTPSIDAIIAEYKIRFGQESVLLVREPVAVRF
jgi:hypothetical protein